MDEKPPQPPRGLKRAAFVLVVAIVLAVPLYVLSSGPVCAMRFFSDATLNTAYRPLLDVLEESETGQAWFWWYMGFWIDAVPPATGPSTYHDPVDS